MAVPESLDERSRWIDLDGPVHYLDFGGGLDRPTVVCVHGLGGSAVNWVALAPRLTDRFRVLALDLAGHGLTQSLGRSTTVAANRGLLHRFIRSVADGPVILIGNSMGGMISLLEAEAAPELVAGLILIDPALPLVPAVPDPMVAAVFTMYATPGLSRLAMDRRRRLSPEAAVRVMLSLCCVDLSRVATDVVELHVQVARRRVGLPGTDKDFLAAARSVLANAMYLSGRSYRRVVGSVAAPVLLVHGERDRLVPVAAARAAARRKPSWSMVVLPDIGHVPQLEAVGDTATAIHDWLDSAGATALAAVGRSRHD